MQILRNRLILMNKWFAGCDNVKLFEFHKNKLIQPLKRTTTYDLRSFQYYGAYVWNMLPINIKTAHSLHEFKSLIRSWPGPTCSCHICTCLTVINVAPMYCTLRRRAVSVTTMWSLVVPCRCDNNLWCRGVVIVTAPRPPPPPPPPV